MNTDDYLNKQYPNPPCWSLVADVFTTELSLPVDEYRTVTDSVRAIAGAFSLYLKKSAHGFQQVGDPQDYDVVLMGRSHALGIHHAGVYWQGSVLHALPSGAYLQDLTTIRDEYELVEFWRR